MDSEKSEENEPEKIIDHQEVSETSELEKTSTPIPAESSLVKDKNLEEKQTDNDLDGLLFSAPGEFFKNCFYQKSLI